MSIPEEHRSYFQSIGAFTRDLMGREVLVGLTAEETADYFRVFEASNLIDRERYIALDAKHEAARLMLIHGKPGGPKQFLSVPA